MINISIEKELFDGYKVDYEKLLQYGFKKVVSIFQYEVNILDNRFRVVVTCDKTIDGKIIDLDFGDEYTNFRRESLGEFNANIKKEYISLLEDVREKCFRKDEFISLQAKRINDFIFREFGVRLEFLWAKYPSYAVYRKGKKWFGLIASIPLNKLDKTSSDEKMVSIINVKLLHEVEYKAGIYEAYHMNKKYWIAIILDDSLKDEEVEELILNSYKAV